MGGVHRCPSSCASHASPPFPLPLSRGPSRRCCGETRYRSRWSWSCLTNRRCRYHCRKKKRGVSGTEPDKVGTLACRAKGSPGSTYRLDLRPAKMLSSTVTSDPLLFGCGLCAAGTPPSKDLPGTSSDRSRTRKEDSVGAALSKLSAPDLRRPNGTENRGMRAAGREDPYQKSSPRNHPCGLA